MTSDDLSHHLLYPDELGAIDDDECIDEIDRYEDLNIFKPYYNEAGNEPLDFEIVLTAREGLVPADSEEDVEKDEIATTPEAAAASSSDSDQYDYLHPESRLFDPLPEIGTKATPSRSSKKRGIFSPPESGAESDAKSDVESEPKSNPGNSPSGAHLGGQGEPEKRRRRR